MAEANRLTITGTVVFIGPRRASPAGIPQQKITIEHRSRQVEAGIPREARCRLDVKVAGEELAGIARTLEVGQQVEVEGFITRAGFRESEASVVLHAEILRVASGANG